MPTADPSPTGDSSPDPGNGSRPLQPSGDSTEVGRLTAALAWVADELVDARQVDQEPRPPRLSWGRNASTFPPDYWHWRHLRAVAERRLATPAGAPRPSAGFRPKDR